MELNFRCGLWGLLLSSVENSSLLQGISKYHKEVGYGRKATTYMNFKGVESWSWLCQTVGSMSYRIQQMVIASANLNERFKQDNESEYPLRVTPLEVWKSVKS